MAVAEVAAAPAAEVEVRPASAPKDSNALIGPHGYDIPPDGTQGFIQPTAAPCPTPSTSRTTAASPPRTSLSPSNSTRISTGPPSSSARSASARLTSPSPPADAVPDHGRYQNTDGSSLNVVVALDFNVQTGLLTVTFTSLDPLTGQAPAGVFDGFLPPEPQSPANSDRRGLRPVHRPAEGQPGHGYGHQSAGLGRLRHQRGPRHGRGDQHHRQHGPRPAASTRCPPPSRPRSPSAGPAQIPGGSGIASYDVYDSVNGGAVYPVAERHHGHVGLLHRPGRRHLRLLQRRDQLCRHRPAHPHRPRPAQPSLLGRSR